MDHHYTVYNHTNVGHFCVCYDIVVNITFQCINHNSYGWASRSISADIDECVLGIGSCGSNGVCLDTFGSYTCVCDPGYTGNGTECISKFPFGSDDRVCHKFNALL